MNSDEWVETGATITGDAVLARVRATLEEEGALIIEHRHYRGARAPTRFVCSSFEEFTAYLNTNTVPGDAFWLWTFDACCRDDNALLTAKRPDAQGRTPKGGAY